MAKRIKKTRGPKTLKDNSGRELKRLKAKILKSPGFAPSFRSEVPLGMTDDMLSFARMGRAAVPLLQGMLKDKDPQVRKAAVVMLTHINSSETEPLLINALSDESVRGEAIVCLGNFYMRNPEGELSGEKHFLRCPDLVLLALLEFVRDETVVTLDSGFPVYKGPAADLAIGAAVRIIGLQSFADILDIEFHMYIGLVPYTLTPVIKESLQTRLERERERLKNLMRGNTGSGTITVSEIATAATNEIKLSFSPGAAGCDCTKIGWIQIAKATLSDGSIGYAAGEKARDTDGDGYLIDRLDGNNNPVYGSGGDAAGTIPADKGKYGKCNGGTGDAELIDKPYGPAGTVIEFESCVFCLEGTDAGKCYGCYKWKYTRAADGTESYTRDGATSKPSAQFRKCANEWNDLPGKTDTPDPAKW